MIAHVTSDGGRHWQYYVCSTYSNRGRTLCANSFRLPMVAAEQAIFDRFKTVVVNPAVLAAAVADVTERLTTTERGSTEARDTLVAELLRVEEEQPRYAVAIATAGDLSVLTDALREREGRRQRLQDQLAALTRPEPAQSTPPAIQRQLRARLTEWRHPLRQRPDKARPVLARLVEGRVTFTPEPELRRS